METPVGDGTLLWEPSEELKQQATLTRYMQWLERENGLRFGDQEALWEWSVNHLEDFWASIWDFFAVKASKPYTRVLADRKMPGARWFPGTALNYAEQVFGNATPDHPALLFQSERHPLTEISWEEFSHKVGSVANALRALGVQRGDRVVAYMGNLPETVIAFLACASIGAVWSSCPPDFGTSSVIERFQQIEPKVLFAVDGY
jgi:acetoacetyl-CoA synthetase